MKKLSTLSFSIAISQYIIQAIYIVYVLYIYIGILYKVCVRKTCTTCYLRITLLIEYVGHLYRVLTCKNMVKCKVIFVCILILKFHFNFALKRCQCTQQDVRKIVGNSLQMHHQV